MILVMACCRGGWAQSPVKIDQRSDPLVRSLEALYVKSMQIALSGDLDAYWRLRTAASRSRPPTLTRELLPLFAQMLPPLDSLSFVGLDFNGRSARALYRWSRTDMTRYTVVVYLLEQDTWRIDSIVVKTDRATNGREAETEKRPAPAPEAAGSQ